MSEQDVAFDQWLQKRVIERRTICGCITWPKPCTECDAYEDAMYEVADWLAEH